MFSIDRVDGSFAVLKNRRARFSGEGACDLDNGSDKSHVQQYRGDSVNVKPIDAKGCGYLSGVQCDCTRPVQKAADKVRKTRFITCFSGFC